MDMNCTVCVCVICVCMCVFFLWPAVSVTNEADARLFVGNSLAFLRLYTQSAFACIWPIGSQSKQGVHLCSLLYSVSLLCDCGIFSCIMFLACIKGKSTVFDVDVGCTTYIIAYNAVCAIVFFGSKISRVISSEKRIEKE